MSLNTTPSARSAFRHSKSFRFADGSIANLTYCTVGSRTSGGERVEAFAHGIGLLTENFKKLGVHTGVRHSRSSWWAEKGYAAQLAGFVEDIREGRPSAVATREVSSTRRRPNSSAP